MKLVNEEMKFTIPPFSWEYFINDFVIAIPAAAIIGATVFGTKKLKNPWVNRKIIHLSVTPAILMYLYVFKEPYAFFIYSIMITLFLLIHHLKSSVMEWFQLKGNLGEVYFAASFAILSIIFWDLREVAAAIMLFMAVGDAITGLVRSRVCRERCKHWIGSLAMLITSSIIGFVLIGALGVLLAVLATISEKQWFIDDNISVPLVSALTFYMINFLLS